MKFYLSSYEIGNETEKLKNLVSNGRIGYIPNARDFTGADPDRVIKRNEKDMNSLSGLGLRVEMLNLKDYFNKQDELENKIKELGAIFISGGNVFVLRQAMKLSGLDEILQNLKDPDFLYAGYSAAGCVLGENLNGMDIVDPLDTPYKEQKEIIWEGLNLVNFRFMPHWNSGHAESSDIDKEIEFCRENNIEYKAIRDGEVIILD